MSDLMSDDLQALYQEVIIDHGTRPRNKGELPNANYTAEGYNPLCGDHITLALDVQNNVIQAVKFLGDGCAISTASASLLTEFLIGKTVEEAQHIFRDFTAMVTSEPDAQYPQLGKLTILAGVNKYPARVKCATLAWHTLQAALEKSASPATTESV